MNLQGIFGMFAHHFRAKTSHFRTQYAARTPSWVPGTIMSGLEEKKRVAQKWSNSLNELLRGLMSYLLADSSD